MTPEEALLIADYGGDHKAAAVVLAEEVRRLTADRDSWAQQASDRAQDALDLVAAERERCAKIVDVPPGTEAWEVIGGEEGFTMLRELAAQIRGA